MSSEEKIDLRKSHADLCKVAVKWLKRPNSASGHGCEVAVSECRSGWTGEIPDAIGFRAEYGQVVSVMVEVKVSRSDFLADRKKPFRLDGMGVGTYRYYLCPEGLIQPEEVPPQWGLVWINSRGHAKVKAGAASKFGGRYDDMQQALIDHKMLNDPAREQWLLVKLLARTGDPEKVSRWLREANANTAINARLAEEKGEEVKAQRRSLNLQQRVLRLYRERFGDIPELAEVGDGCYWLGEPVIPRLGMQLLDSFDEARVDRVASSHGDGEHYDELVSK